MNIPIIEGVRRKAREQARRDYEARLSQLLGVLAQYPTVTIIRDAQGVTLQDRQLEGPLVFVGGEQITIMGCSFLEAAKEREPA